MTLGLQALLAFIPIGLSGLLLIGLGWSAKRAMPLVYFVTAAIALLAWGVSLNRPKWNLRINENYRGIQRRGIVASTATNGIEPGTYNYRPKRLYIDISGEYFITRQLGFFIALRNFGGATEDQKTYGPNTPV